MAVENKQYIRLMIEDLQKKSGLLDKIIEVNERQKKIINQPDMDLDEFGSTVEEKSGYVDEINALDVGFQRLFEHVREALNGNKELYSEEIRTMQELIRAVTDKSVAIQAEEERNRLTIEGQFAKMKQEVRRAKKSMGVADNYYKSMSGTAVVDSQFMDIKN